MVFNPDQYLSEKISQSPTSGFDPEAYLKTKSISKSPETSEIESAMRGAAQGATFGFAPAISGAAQAIPTAIEAAYGSASIKDIIDAYNKGRQHSKEEFEAAEKANPKSYIAGTLAGSLAPAVLTGGASEAATGIGAAAKVGAGYGAISGAGNAISSGEDTSGVVKDAAVGSVAGGALGGAIGAATPVLSRAFSKTGELLGSPLSAIGDLIKKTELGSTMSKAYEMGRGGENLLSKSTREAIGQEPVQLGEKYIGKEGLFRNSLKEKGTEIGTAVAGGEGNPIDIQKEGLLDKMNAAISRLDDRDPAQKADKAKIQQLINNYTGMTEKEALSTAPIKGSGPSNEFTFDDFEPKISGEELPSQVMLEPSDLQSLKGAISDLSPFKNDSMRTNVGAGVTKTIAKEIGEVSEANTPGLEDANKAYSDMAYALRMLKIKPESVDMEKQAENLGNIIYRLKNTTQTGDKARFRFDKAMDKLDSVNPELAGQFKQEAMDVAARLEVARKASAEAVGGTSIGKAVSGYSTKGANLAGQLSNNIGDVSRTLTGLPKEGVVAMGQQLISSGDPLAQRLGNVLVKAGDRDDIGRNALIFSIMQNSGYRSLLNQYLNTSENKK